MQQIPVTFTHQKKHYTGHLLAVSGAGSNHYHLMIDNFYCGQLWLTHHFGWQMDGEFRGLAEELGRVVEKGVVMEF